MQPFLSSGASLHLPEGFLDSLVAELDGPDIKGIALGGSYNRGEATVYSDVDLAPVVATDDQVKPKRLEYRDGLLVSISTKSLVGVRADMKRPERAIWVVPGLRACRILLDKDGSLEALAKELEEFAWEPLQEAANRYASYHLMLGSEVAHKVLSECLRGNEPAISIAASTLIYRLAEWVAVQRGVFVVNESAFPWQVEAAVGSESRWAHYYRLVTGTRVAPEGVSPALALGATALRLYAETVEAIRPAMLPEHLVVAEQTVLTIQEARARRVIPEAI